MKKFFIHCLIILIFCNFTGILTTLAFANDFLSKYEHVKKNRKKPVYIVKKSGKYGLVIKNEDTYSEVLEPIFEKMIFFDIDIALNDEKETKTWLGVGKKDNSYWIYQYNNSDKNNDIKIIQGTYLYKNKDKYGIFIGDKELKIIKPMFDKIYLKDTNKELFQDLNASTKDIALVKLKLKWYFIDEYGKTNNNIDKNSLNILEQYKTENKLSMSEEILFNKNILKTSKEKVANGYKYSFAINGNQLPYQYMSLSKKINKSILYVVFSPAYIFAGAFIGFEAILIASAIPMIFIISKLLDF